MKKGKALSERAESREAILDAAERIFASHGYEGASMKGIAGEAGTAQALIHYYFSSKESLYEAIFERQSRIINTHREQAIVALLAKDKSPSLEQLLDIMFQAVPTRNGPLGGPNSAFTQIVSATIVGDDDRSKSMMIKYYDGIARQFIDAFRQVLPELSHADAVWAYLFAHGARMNLYARNGRAERLSAGTATSNFDAAVAKLRTFTAVGIRALAHTNVAQTQQRNARKQSAAPEATTRLRPRRRA